MDMVHIHLQSYVLKWNKPECIQVQMGHKGMQVEPVISCKPAGSLRLNIVTLSWISCDMPVPSPLI